MLASEREREREIARGLLAILAACGRVTALQILVEAFAVGAKFTAGVLTGG